MKFKNPVSVVSPVDGEHATNKEYVDNKQVTISWVEYQALSEEEKCNGTVYYIPDMPVSPNGEVIGEVERLNGYLASDASLSNGSIIPFVGDSNSNMSITNGLITLKKGKTYNIFCDSRFSFTSGSTSAYCRYGIKDGNGNQIGAFGFDVPRTWTAGSTGQHLSAGYTITATDDMTIGIYVLSCDSLTTASSSYSKLVITEIPSLQACIDVTDEHIKEVATNGYIKTFGCTSSSITMNGIGNKDVVTDISSYIPTGYTVIGVISFWSGHGDICFSGCELRGNNWHAQIRNTYEGSKTFTLSARFLAIKS